MHHPRTSGCGWFYLRVRTNVPWNASADQIFNFTDNTSVDGNGSNRFSVRANPPNTTDRTKVSVSPYSRMPIFANSDNGAATSNLIRVLPGNAGQGHQLHVLRCWRRRLGRHRLRPHAQWERCNQLHQEEDFRTEGNDADCSISNILNSNGWNGQFRRMRIPIPRPMTATRTATASTERGSRSGCGVVLRRRHRDRPDHVDRRG